MNAKLRTAFHVLTNTLKASKINVVDGVLSLLFLLTLQIAYNPRFYYFDFNNYNRSRQPLDVFLNGFLSFTPDFPGKPLQYLSAALMHLFYYPWLGALIITLVAIAITVAFRQYLMAIFKKKGWIVGYLPAIMILGHWVTCEFILNDALVVLCALSCAVLYMQGTRMAAPLRLIIFGSAGFLLFIAAGHAAFVFALFVLIYELFVCKQYRLSLGYVIIMLALPLTARMLYDTYIRELYATCYPIFTIFQNKPPNIAQWLFYGSPFLGTLTVGLYSYFAARRPKIQRNKGRPFDTVLKSIGQSWINCFVVVIGIALTVVLSLQSSKLFFGEMIFYYQLGQWDKLIHHLDKLPAGQSNPLIAHATDRALFENGDLLSKLFHYPQNPAFLILHKSELSSKERYFATLSSETLMRLGFVNAAENELYDIVSDNSYVPLCMKNLFYISVAKNMPSEGRTWLNALARDYIYRPWASDYLRRMETDSLLLSDTTVQALRRNMPDTTQDHLKRPRLDDLLEKNPHNRMALEYLMAEYLLKSKLDSIVNNLHRFKECEYPSLPPLIEQAVLIYCYNNELDSLKTEIPISQESMLQFWGPGGIAEIIHRNQGNTRRAFSEMARKYHYTFYFYFLYGQVFKT